MVVDEVRVVRIVRLMVLVNLMMWETRVVQFCGDSRRVEDQLVDLGCPGEAGEDVVLEKF